MIKRATFIGTLALALGAAGAYAEDVARWVDADGTTHFGNFQFAPRGADHVAVPPANHMAVPVGASFGAPANGARGGPSVVVLEKKPNRRLIGWRGYAWSVRNNPRTIRRR